MLWRRMICKAFFQVGIECSWILDWDLYVDFERSFINGLWQSLELWVGEVNLLEGGLSLGSLNNRKMVQKVKD